MGHKEGDGLFRVVVLELASTGAQMRMEHLRLLGEPLQREMRARGLLDLPPAYLGFMDLDVWDAQGLLLLACEAFDFAITGRLDALAAKATQYRNIDGLIRLNLRNFLTERQGANDPIGKAVYDNLHASAKAGLDAGWLSSLSTKKMLRGDQVLCATGREGEPVVSTAVIDDKLEPSEPMRCRLWDLRMVGPDGRTSGSEILRLLLDLGIVAFTLSAVARVLSPRCRDEVMARHHDEDTAYDECADGFPMLVQVMQPSAFESYRDWLDFCKTARRRLEVCDKPIALRERMSRLFEVLVGCVERDVILDIKQTDLKIELGLARSTMSDCVRELHEVISTESSDSSLTGPVSDRTEGSLASL